MSDSAISDSTIDDSALVVWTIGHSTRPIEEFIELLQANRVTLIADVRKLPGSRRFPHFNQEELTKSLDAAGIAYRHFPGLGGRRPARKNSPVGDWENSAWKSATFRGFADYMQTHEFAENLDEIIGQASSHRVALMCAEAVPWRCHRSLIADALVAHSVRVENIISDGKTQPHTLKPWARVTGTRVTYPADSGADAADSPSRLLFPK
jgi:uncharacterized protein (DUF488 family)